MAAHTKVLKGRGATINPAGRYDHYCHEAVDDGWESSDEPSPKLNTSFVMDSCRTVITYNQSPDLPFDRSINPYRGCEHGCSYCFARPSHAYLGLSPGLDFESRLAVKPDLAELLKMELSHPRYRCRTIALGTNTDPYQPVERELRLTRSILQIMIECGHPVGIVTKGVLIERDIDLLTQMAAENLAEVMISVTTLDKALARKLEPRAPAPQRRLETIARLSGAGIPTGVMVAPVIPQLNDDEMEAILARAAEAGSRCADYVMLRLPGEVGGIFSDWLDHHYPLKARHVLNAIRDVRGGHINDSGFGRRLSGTGAYAEMIAQRFRLQCRRLGLNRNGRTLSVDKFRPPREGPWQADLFDPE
ncbi:MAG: PA0069 family radical SAM protein [Gammaproteobacteria bacterium]